MNVLSGFGWVGCCYGRTDADGDASPGAGAGAAFPAAVDADDDGGDDGRESGYEVTRQLMNDGEEVLDAAVQWQALTWLCFVMEGQRHSTPAQVGIRTVIRAGDRQRNLVIVSRVGRYFTWSIISQLRYLAVRYVKYVCTHVTSPGTVQ